MKYIALFWQQLINLSIIFKPGSAILLFMHTTCRAIMQDLCLEEHSFVNDFGNQSEVSAHSSFSKNQKSVCDMERLVRSPCSRHAAVMHTI